MKNTSLPMKWSEVKAFLDSRKIVAQYVELDGTYMIFGMDGPLQMFCYLHIEDPASADQVDFETNYKPIANKTFSDADGSLLSRTKVTQTGWQYHLQGLEFTSSKLSSTYNADEDGNDLGFSSIKLYDTNGVEITDPLNEGQAVKTIVEWEPTFDYEILGGTLKMETDTTEDIRLYVTAVPDIPAAFGGSKNFICCVNMKFVKVGDKIEADGRAAKKMVYDAVNHTNKMRITLTHGAGIQCSFSMMFEVFKQ